MVLKNVNQLNNFQRDLQQEQYPVQFILKYLYGLYITPKYGIIANYMYDKKVQLSGIDVVHYHLNGKRENIDFKAQMNKYIGNPTPTFCLELEYLKNDVIKQGWLFREDLQTDIYAFIWINKANYTKTENDKLLSDLDQIQDITVRYVHKGILLNYLKGAGISPNSLNIEKLKQRYPNEKNCKQLRINNDIKLFQTMYLPEQPVNLVISNKIWEQLACSSYNIYKENAQIIIHIYKENSIFLDKVLKFN